MIRLSGRVVFEIENIPIGTFRVDVTVGGRPVNFEIRDSDNNSYGRGPIAYGPETRSI